MKFKKRINDNFYDGGLLPDTPEEIAELAAGRVSFESFISGEWALGPYPQAKYKVPPDITWESFKPELIRRKAHFDAMANNGWCLWWWEIARAYGLPMNQVSKWNQYAIPSCAGFSAAAAYSRKVLYQKLTAPVLWEQINPICTWAITKNYSTSGGQGMIAVRLGTAKYGNYAVTDPGIGEYPGRVDRTVYEKNAPRAQSRQLCSCSIPNPTVEDIRLCLDAREVVAIGNYTACRSCRLDGNKIKVGVIGGRWSHAQNYDSIRYVKGQPYFHWSNSWGDIYKGSVEGDPDIGCWHTADMVHAMLQGASCWVTVYAEAFPEPNLQTRNFVPPFIGYPDYVLHKHS
jgi:hypothetical protein